MPAYTVRGSRSIAVLCLGVAMVFLAAASSRAQEGREQIAPVITPQQIETCIGADTTLCPLDDRLALIRSLNTEVERLAGQIGLLCEINPGDCPSLDTINNLHAQYQAMDQLIWGLPQYRINQTPNPARMGIRLPETPRSTE